jgi:hypothetical protein
MRKARAVTSAVWLAAFALVAGGLVWMVLDAAARRREHAQRLAMRAAMVRLVGTADLFVSSSSRWIRHLSVTEPGAAFADGPAILDGDPGGGFVGPSTELLGQGSSPELVTIRKETP